MKQARKKRKHEILEHQAVSRKRKGRGIWLRFGTIWSLCKGCFKGVGALLILTLVSILFLSGYHYLVTSPYLQLEQVEVNGVSDRFKGELLRMADFRPGVSLLELNLQKVRKRLEAHPWIRSVEVERRFPHTLLISVEKQEPRAILLSDGMYYLNRFGEVFKKVNSSEDADLPVITGMSENKIKEKTMLKEVARVMEKLQEEKSPWSLADLGELHVEGANFFTLYFEHMGAGIKVNGEALRKEVRDLRRVVAHLSHSGRMERVSSIDFSYRGGAVVSFRKG